MDSKPNGELVLTGSIFATDWSLTMAVFDRSAIKSHGAKQRTTKQEKWDLIAQMEEVSRAEARQLYVFASEHKDMFTETEIAIYKAASEIGGLERYKRYEKKKERARLAGLKLSQLKPGAFEDDKEWEEAAFGGGRTVRTGLDGKSVGDTDATTVKPAKRTRRVRTTAQKASDRVAGKAASKKSTATKASSKSAVKKTSASRSKSTGRASAVAGKLGSSSKSASKKVPSTKKATTSRSASAEKSAAKSSASAKKTAPKKSASAKRAGATARKKTGGAASAVTRKLNGTKVPKK